MNLTVYNISRAEVKKIKYLSPANDAMILILEPGGEEVKFDFENQPNFLKVYFWDIRGEFKKDGKLYQPLDDNLAHEIINFIIDNQDKNFTIACQAGISRSSAIALFISNIFGHKLKYNFWDVSNPNELVLGKLLINYKRQEH